MTLCRHSLLHTEGWFNSPVPIDHEIVFSELVRLSSRNLFEQYRYQLSPWHLFVRPFEQMLAFIGQVQGRDPNANRRPSVRSHSGERSGADSRVHARFRPCKRTGSEFQFARWRPDRQGTFRPFSSLSLNSLTSGGSAICYINS